MIYVSLTLIFIIGSVTSLLHLSSLSDWNWEQTSLLIVLVARKQKKYLCTSLKAQLNHERIKKCNDELRENKYLVKRSNDYLKQLW